MDSGLQLSILEPVAVEYCNQTVNKLIIFVITLAYIITIVVVIAFLKGMQ